MSTTVDADGQIVWVDDEDTVTGGDSGNDSGSSDTDAFDWDNFYDEYGNASADLGANAPTEADVQAAIAEGKSSQPFLKNIFDTLGTAGTNFIKKYLYDSATGKVNIAGLATAATALYSIFGDGSKIQKGGYDKPVPKLDLTRKQVQYNDPNRRPGEAGRDYFTPSQFTTTGDATALANAQTLADTQAQGILAGYTPRPAVVNPYAGKFKTPWETSAASTNTNANTQAASGVAQLMPVPDAATYDPTKVGAKTMADGGIAALAKGRYLAGSTDGMADEIPTSIDGKDPAALSHGEFVIPADVVSHLGNGNSEAGAQKLYAMMDKVRKARTGTTKQGKRINPDKFMPGGIAGYAGGGEVRHFETGGSTTNTSSNAGTSTSSSLSPWAGEYTTNLLGEASALAKAPFQAYKGPLTAGASDLQNQAFAGIGTLAGAGYTPTTYNAGTFGAQQAQQYMNPYIQAALNPQLAEMQRQAEIKRVADAGRMTQAGAFGGSRQAIMEAEGNRGLLDLQTRAIGEGYQTAYDKAMGQFNTEQDRRLGAEKASEASRQYSADYGLKSLGELANLGATQRDIEAQGIAADKAQFEEQRDYPASMIKFKRDLITGLPISTTDTAATTDAIGRISNQVNDMLGLYKTLANLGQA